MSIEPHASPTVEAVASLQKEAERVKPGNHVEQVKTESETLETVAAFGGLPMGDLIARPVLEASKAQQALAEHMAIYEAVACGDGAKAQALAEQHAANAKAQYCKQCREGSE